MKNKQERSNRPERARTAGVSADLLKLTALITMLIDHIGAGILERLLIDGYVTDYTLYLKIYQLDSVLRIIGRISFPIFCFLLAEGFLHTRSRRGYAFRLLVFALLSEKFPLTCSFPAVSTETARTCSGRFSSAFWCSGAWMVCGEPSARGKSPACMAGRADRKRTGLFGARRRRRGFCSLSRRACVRRLF